MPSERVLLVTIQLDPRFARSTPWPLEDEAAELRELAVAAGARVVGELSARRHRPVAGTFLGRGKLEEIVGAVDDLQVQAVIFNQELSSAQQRNIEDVLKVKTIDRTQLILDIFAQRARSREGKVQVELAQLRYLLPRLVGKGIALSRLGGGIGTRGPGEQKLEVDRRRIRQRISRLDGELEKLGSRRQASRSRRQEAEVPVAALIGYTNAGKTTLLNRLSGAGASAKNQLFTTLDPLARRVRLAGGEGIVFTDTVGFLHDLPHHLIEAFKATLEEARDATVLVHVLDASHALALDHATAVEAVLAELKLREKPLITVLNKRDLVRGATSLEAMALAFQPSVAISAKTGEGVDELESLIGEQLDVLLVAPTRLFIPSERSDVVARLYREGQVLRRTEADGVITVTARLPAKSRGRLTEFIAP